MSAPSLEAVAVTLREFVARAGALRAVALLDRGEGAAPVVVDCDGDGTVEVEEGGDVRRLPAVSAAAPLALPHVRPLPPMEVDAGSGRVTGTIGGLQYLADAVGELASALGGRSVATVQFQTTDPDAPLAVSARAGEAPVLALGDQTFALPS